MKEKILVLITLGWLLILPITAGVKAVFPYNYPSKNSLKSLVMENSPKGRAYADYLLYAVNLALADTTLIVNKDNIDILFDNLHSEEFILQEGEYMNSGYDDISKKMVPSLGHRWQGFVWTLRIGTYTIRLIKTDCANILIAKVIRKKIVPITILEKKIERPQEVLPKEELIEKPYQSYQSRGLVKERDISLPSITPKKEKRGEVKIWNFVIPVSAILVGGLYYFSKRNDKTSYRGRTDNGDYRNPPSPPSDEEGPIDPPPNDGGPIDPPPSDGGPVDPPRSGY